jgi:hypothetical protein
MSRLHIRSHSKSSKTKNSAQSKVRHFETIIKWISSIYQIKIKNFKYVLTYFDVCDRFTSAKPMKTTAGRKN